MRRGRVFIYLALIFILLLAGGYLVYTRVYLPSQTAQPTVEEEVVQATPTPVVQMIEVVVLTQPLARGAMVTEDVLKMVPYPEDVLIETMFTDMGQVIQRQAKFDLEAGIVLTG